jgi:hypothetical protein
VIEEIRKLMLRSARSSQQREVEQRRAFHSSRKEEEEDAATMMQEHRSTSCKCCQHANMPDAQWRKGEAPTLPFLKFEI